jgi:methionyl-tRNA formyltransferase
VRLKWSIDSVFLEEDSGLTNDPIAQMVQLVETLGIKPGNYSSSVGNSDVALAVGWKRMIEHEYSNLFIIHDSLLPKYRGWNPLVTALQNGDNLIGVTLFLATKDVDCGPIVAQEEIGIDYPIKLDRAIALVDSRIKLLIRQLDTYLFSDIKSLKPQLEHLATYSLWRDDQDFQIDWSLDSEAIENFVNSVSFPYAGASTFIKGERIRIFDVKQVPDISIANRTPGKVIKGDSQSFTVVCGKGLLEICDARLDTNLSQPFVLKSLKTRLN